MKNGFYQFTYRDGSRGYGVYSNSWYLIVGHDTPMQANHFDPYICKARFINAIYFDEEISKADRVCSCDRPRPVVNFKAWRVECWDCFLSVPLMKFAKEVLKGNIKKG